MKAAFVLVLVILGASRPSLAQNTVTWHVSIYDEPPLVDMNVDSSGDDVTCAKDLVNHILAQEPVAYLHLKVDWAKHIWNPLSQFFNFTAVAPNSPTKYKGRVQVMRYYHNGKLTCSLNTYMDTALTNKAFRLIQVDNKKEILDLIGVDYAPSSRY
jgi:hypothetical protein